MNKIKRHLTTLLISILLFGNIGCKTTNIDNMKIADTVEVSKSTYCIVIGMEKSKAFGECPGCTLDSNNMKALLTPYASAGMTFLQNSQATKENVLSAFDKALSTNPDLIIFYYSGHGGHAQFSHTTEKDNEDEFLCLYDTYLLDDLIWEKLIVKSKRIHLIFDCCHSETMFKTSNIKMTFESQIDIYSKNMNSFANSRDVIDLNQSVNMLVWSGCPDSSYSYGNSNGGLFTNTLLKQFNRNKTYWQLWKEIDASSAVKRQNPQVTQFGKGFAGKVFE